MNTTQKPSFAVFAKRRNSQDPVCQLYVKVTYQGKLHEKSLGYKCMHHDWQPSEIAIKDNPKMTEQVKEALEEIKQKVMGAYYVLIKMNNEVELNDIVRLANGEQASEIFSFAQCFKNLIERMEKMKGKEGNSEANLQKHSRCLEHFIQYCKLFHKCTNLSFQKINRTTIDQLADYFRPMENARLLQTKPD